MADRSDIARIELDGGAVIFRRTPSVVLVLNGLADAIFGRLLDGVSRERIAAELERRFPHVARTEIDDAIDETSLSFEDLLADPPAAGPDGPPSFDGSSWTFDRIVQLGAAATRLQIACHDFDALMLDVYGPAMRRPGAGARIERFLQVAPKNGGYWLRRNSDSVTGSFNRHGAFLEIQRHLLSTAHAPRRTHLILHASVVADEASGKSLILAGGSGSGKSSLTAACLFRGYRFVTDDVAIIDAESHELWPLQLPLRLKAGSWEPIAPRVAAAFFRWELIDEAGGRRVWRLYPKNSAADQQAFAPPCSAILFPLFEAAAATEIERIDPLAALALMVESGAWFETDEPAMVGTIAWLSTVPCYSVIFSSAENVADVIQDLL